MRPGSSVVRTTGCVVTVRTTTSGFAGGGGAWLREQHTRVSPNGKTAKAIAYSLNAWDALVRFLECERSVEFAAAQLDHLPDGEVRAAVGPLAPRALVVTLVEGWRGYAAERHPRVPVGGHRELVALQDRAVGVVQCWSHPLVPGRGEHHATPVLELQEAACPGRDAQ